MDAAKDPPPAELGPARAKALRYASDAHHLGAWAALVREDWAQFLKRVPPSKRRTALRALADVLTAQEARRLARLVPAKPGPAPDGLRRRSVPGLDRLGNWTAWELSAPRVRSGAVDVRRPARRRGRAVMLQWDEFLPGTTDVLEPPRAVEPTAPPTSDAARVPSLLETASRLDPQTRLELIAAVGRLAFGRCADDDLAPDAYRAAARASRRLASQARRGGWEAWEAAYLAAACAALMGRGRRRLVRATAPPLVE